MKKFPVVYNMNPDDLYYKSKIFEIEEENAVEITADKPIQVRINNGPWVNVRPSDLNKK